MGIFEDFGIKYHELGWSVIPLIDGNRAFIKGWDNLRYRQPTDEEFKEMCKHPCTGFGLITGAFNNLMVVDIDLDELVEPVMKLLPATPFRRLGSKGIALFYKYHPNISGQSLPKVDIIVNGQIAMPPSIHKKGMQYKWLGLPLEDKEDLPVILPSHIRAVELLLGKKDSPIANLDIKSGGRNDRLKQLVNAMLHRNEPIGKVIEELIEVDKLHQTPLFTDGKEFNGETDLYKNALSFFNNIYKHFTKCDNIYNPQAKIDLSKQLTGQPKDSDELQRSDIILVEDFREADIMPPVGIWGNFMPNEGLAIIGGPPKRGKSTWVLNLCRAISTGEDFLSFPTTEGLVLLFSPEGSKYHLQQNFIRMNIHKNVAMINKTPTIKLLTEAYKFIQPSIIIFDTLGKCIPTMMDYNDYGKVNNILEPYDDLSKEYNSLILATHHATKALETSDEINFLGSQAFRGITQFNGQYIRNKKRNCLLIEAKDGDYPSKIDFYYDKKTRLHTAKKIHGLDKKEDSTEEKENEKVDLSSYIDDRFLVLAKRIYKIIENEKKISKTNLFKQARVNREHFNIVLKALLINEFITFKEILVGNIKTTFCIVNKCTNKTL